MMMLIFEMGIRLEIIIMTVMMVMAMVMVMVMRLRLIHVMGMIPEIIIMMAMVCNQYHSQLIYCSTTVNDEQDKKGPPMK